MDRALNFGLHVCKDGPKNENDAVMFDIDDTLLTRDGFQIKEMVKLFNICKQKGYVTVIITARPGTDYNAFFTRRELFENNIIPDKLVFAKPEQKTKAKKILGHNFVLSVGDQYTDLGGSNHCIKLPDQHDKNVYVK